MVPSEVALCHACRFLTHPGHHVRPCEQCGEQQALFCCDCWESEAWACWVAERTHA